MRLQQTRLCVQIVLLSFVAVSAGCVDQGTSEPAKLKTTDDIGEFKEGEADEEVVTSEVTITNPVTGALEAYEPLKQQVSELAIQHALDLYQATNGEYPKNHDEFMTHIIKANNIRLPQLSADKHYKYDVENHKLMVVREVKAAE